MIGILSVAMPIHFQSTQNLPKTKAPGLHVPIRLVQLYIWFQN